MANNIPALFSGSANVPAFLKSAEVTNALAAHHTEGFPSMSLKGKTWTVKKGGESKLLMNPKDPDSPASYIEVVIVKANPVKTKVWYATTWADGEEQGKPTCFSRDGIKPDPQSEKQQSKTCALCPKNQWGSKVNLDGTPSKGKACGDNIRMAIAALSDLDNPMLLRVPPASIKPAGEYGQMLAKRGVPLEAVITKLRFDPEAPTPKVLFEPVGFLSEEQFNHVKEVAASERVEAILGGSPAVDEGEAQADALGEVPAHLKAATPPAKPKATPKAEPKPPVKTPEEIAAEEEERLLAELMAKKALRDAKQITPTKTVRVDEIEAAVQAAEQGLGVAGAPKVSEVVSASQAAVDAGSIEVEAIPSLENITFDD